MQPSLGATISVTNITTNALAAVFGGVTQAARAIGIPRSTLYGHTLGRTAGFTAVTAQRIGNAILTLNAQDYEQLLSVKGLLEREALVNVPTLTQLYIQHPITMELDIQQAFNFMAARGLSLDDFAAGKRS